MVAAFGVGQIASWACSDGCVIAVRGPDAEALDIILKGAERIVQVSDVEIGAAMRAIW